MKRLNWPWSPEIKLMSEKKKEKTPEKDAELLGKLFKGPDKKD